MPVTPPISSGGGLKVIASGVAALVLGAGSIGQGAQEPFNVTVDGVQSGDLVLWGTDSNGLNNMGDGTGAVAFQFSQCNSGQVQIWFANSSLVNSFSPSGNIVYSIVRP